jgi:DNA-binding MarR family transcriptional regulator
MPVHADELAQCIQFLTVRFKERERLFAGRLEVSERELALMRSLAAEGPMIIKDLGARFNVPVSTMTGLVDRMEAKGVLRRAPGRRDRRSIELELTPAGARSLREHARHIRTIAAAMLDALPARDQTMLITILRRIRERLEAPPGRAAS